jgi:hypothetical protein
MRDNEKEVGGIVSSDGGIDFATDPDGHLTEEERKEIVCLLWSFFASPQFAFVPANFILKDRKLVRRLDWILIPWVSCLITRQTTTMIEDGF